MTKIKKGNGNAPKITNHQPNMMDLDHSLAAEFAVVVMISNKECSKMLSEYCAGQFHNMNEIESFMKCVGLMLAVGAGARKEMQSKFPNDGRMLVAITFAERATQILNLNKYGRY